MKIKIIRAKFKELFSFFEPSANAINRYLKYSLFFILFTLAFSTFTGNYSIIAPPATFIIVFYIDRKIYRIIAGFLASTIYTYQYVTATYNIPLEVVISGLGLKTLSVAIFPLLLIGALSFLALRFSKMLSIKKLFRIIKRYI